MIRTAAAALLSASLVFVLLIAGCGGDKTYHVWGDITYQGKPVPAGQVIFEPAAGNSGPPGFAVIKDGRYDTRILDGHGVIGGPHVIRIHGRDGIPRGEVLTGRQMFPDYVVELDVPKKSEQHNFEVPAGEKR